ncbi:MAG TPA: ABC transporter permease [Candidatus Bathyarchaeia archaeon]|nr:MAG: tungstate transporter permease [Candidatus Bathyarchaeota archaeon RBG_16_48_13]HJX23434.1 ABC transporter permease [Candidatus Bathyarchaeia archaeon]
MAGWDELFQGIVRAFQLILSGDPEVLRITFLSLRVSGSAVLIAALIGIPVGTIIALSAFRGKALVVSLLNTLMGLPPVVVGLVLYLLLSSYGPLGFFRLLYTPEAMIIAQVLMATPVIAGVSLSSITSVDPRVREASVSLGADNIQQIRVVLNEARLGLITSVVVGFGAAISEVGAIMMVGGNLLGYTRALTTAIVLLTNQGDFVEAIALGMVLLIMAFSINVVLTLLQVKTKSGLFVTRK